MSNEAESPNDCELPRWVKLVNEIVASNTGDMRRRKVK